MLFQEATANTDGYMIAGYVIAFIIMALYVASIYIRNRNLNRDLTLLEEMEQIAEAEQAKPKNAPKSVTKRKGKK